MSESEKVTVGAKVFAGTHEVGTVEEVIVDSTSAANTMIVVRTYEGRRVEVPATVVDPATTEGDVHLRVATDAEADETSPPDLSGTLEVVGDRLVIPIREEVLIPSTHPVELGTVKVAKRVETVPMETTVDVTRDDVTVDRIPIDRQVDSVPAPRHEGDTLIVPVVEEVLVTEKRLMLREEIRITRRQINEKVPVSDTVRREVVEITDPVRRDLRGGRPGGAQARTRTLDGRPLLVTTVIARAPTEEHPRSRRSWKTQPPSRPLSPLVMP